MLLEEAGLSAADLDEVIMAGAFGSYLDPLNALRIGLLPPVPLGCIRQVGNAAGVGARLALVLQPLQAPLASQEFSQRWLQKFAVLSFPTIYQRTQKAIGHLPIR